MKRRRNVIISLLLVAALALGIGYAAVTDVLDITGSADVSAAQVEEMKQSCAQRREKMAKLYKLSFELSK